MKSDVFIVDDKSSLRFLGMTPSTTAVSLSIKSKNKENKRLFSTIFGDMNNKSNTHEEEKEKEKEKNVTAVILGNEEEIFQVWRPVDTARLAETLGAPAHLLPQVTQLFSPFMESFLQPPIQ